MRYSPYQIHAFCVNKARYARRRARQKRMDYDISIDFLVDLFGDGACPICGRAMLIGGDTSRGRGRMRATAATLDRIDPLGGYTTSNVRFLCHQCNAMKGVLSDADVLRTARAIVRSARASARAARAVIDQNQHVLPLDSAASH